MLQIKEISKTFNPGTVNEKKALRSLSLTLADGDFVTVIGGNGAGKSTLLNAIAGTWFVDEGKILLDDKDVTGLPEDVYKRQVGSLLPGMNVDGNIILDQAEDALVIPVDALMRGNKVYVKDASATEQQGNVPAGFKSVDVERCV